MAWLLAGLTGLFAAGCDSPLEAVVVRVTHRVFPAFNETRRVAPGERFQIGDTEYSGRVAELLPDFAFDEKTRKPFSRSSELRNPAIRIEVYEGDRKIEDAWAFQGDGPPHYAKTSLLAFRIEELIWRPGMAPAAPRDAAGSAADSASADRTAADSTSRAPGSPAGEPADSAAARKGLPEPPERP